MPEIHNLLINKDEFLLNQVQVLLEAQKTMKNEQNQVRKRSNSQNHYLNQDMED